MQGPLKLATHVEEVQPGSKTFDPAGDDSDSESDTSVDGKNLEMLIAMLDLAPKRLGTDEEAKMAYKNAKNTPFKEWSPDVQEYTKRAQANGAGLSKGLAGLVQSAWSATANLTAEQEMRVLETTTLKEYNDLLKTFEREAAGNLSQSGTVTDISDAKKRRNNKNKNKNSKLKQKEAKATREENPNADSGSPANKLA